MKTSRKLYKKGGIVWRVWLYNWVKKAWQWGESHEKVVSHRPLWTRATVDAAWHFNAFPRFLTCFRTTFIRFSGSYCHNISEQIFWAWVLEDGARRPPSYFKIPWLLFILGVVIIKQVTLVGRWPPCHVLQHPSFLSSLLSSLFFIGGHNASHGGRGTETTVLL